MPAFLGEISVPGNNGKGTSPLLWCFGHGDVQKRELLDHSIAAGSNKRNH